MLRALCPTVAARYKRWTSTGRHVLGLCVPQWFGAGDLEQDARDAVARGATLGFQVLQRELGGCVASQWKVVDVDHRERVGAGKVKYHSALSKVAVQMSQQLQMVQPEQVFTIGGDCSVDLAPMSYLRQRYGPRMLVAYIDAHADLNAEWETPSGHFHGMSLRAMLGTAPKDLAPAVALEASRLVLLGARDLDPAEQKFIEENEVRMLRSSELKDLGSETAAQVLETVARVLDKSLLHIHLDLDVLDPAEFPHVNVPSPGGLSVMQLQQLLQSISLQFQGRLCGLTVTEFRPRGTPWTEVETQHCQALISSFLGPEGLDVASQVLSWRHAT